jgi:predicted nucleotidyltransferase
MLPSGSSSTVAVTYFDRAAVRQAAEALAERLGRHPEVEEVILFGSVAWGVPVPGSDVDLLLVLSDSDAPFPERIARYVPTGFPVGVDVFPYTREEIARMRAEGNVLVRDALYRGLSLFRRRS